MSLSAAREVHDESESDERLMLNHLLTSIVDPYRNGSRQTIGQLIASAIGKNGELAAEDANKVLGTYGLKFLFEDGRRWLLIANRNQALAGLFSGTHWQGKSGATNVWVQAARRLPGAEAGPRIYSIGGVPGRVTRVPVEAILDGNAETEENQRAQDGTLTR